MAGCPTPGRRFDPAHKKTWLTGAKPQQDHSREEQTWTDANSWPARPQPPRRSPPAPRRRRTPIRRGPITLINPFPPGGAADVVGRPFAAVLEPIVKQPVVIETKAGAAGAVGAQFAATAKPDGYTLLLHIVSISGFAEMDKLFGRQPKFTRADFIPIARFTEGPMVIVVNDQTPYKTLKELVDDAKKRPDEIIFSSSGLYGALHLPTALFMKAAGIQMRHLPTNGGGPALTALLGNNSQVLVSSIAAANAQIKAGKLRALACFSTKRAASLPNVPTLKELGYDVEFSLWVGLFAPKGTPDAIVNKLRAEFEEGRRREQFKKAIDNIGDVVAYLDQPEFAKFWDEDAKRVEAAVQADRQGMSLEAGPNGGGSGQRMILRRDHVAGGVFVAGGAILFAMSGDLPFGTLASPGAGMLPKLVLVLMIVFGALLMLRAGESPPLADVAWADFSTPRRSSPRQPSRSALHDDRLHSEHVAAAVCADLFRRAPGLWRRSRSASA